MSLPIALSFIPVQDIKGQYVGRILNTLPVDAPGLYIPPSTVAPPLTEDTTKISIVEGSYYVLPANTLTANRELTITDDGSPMTQEVLTITRYDSGPFEYTLNSGFGSLVLPASVKIAVQLKFDGSRWQVDQIIRIQ